jgi:predicted RNA binding protein with dsRBD fold (UPF0201 family)
MDEALRHQRLSDAARTREEVGMRGARFQLAHQAMVNLAMTAQCV